MRRILFAVIIAAGPLFSGTLIKTQVKALPANTVTEQEMLLEDNRFRLNDASTSILFHQVNGQWVLDILNKQRNEVMRMDEQYIAQISQQLAGVNEQMAAAMAKMDAKQKALMEQMMKGKLGKMLPSAAAPVQTIYTATGNATISGFACREYDGRRGAQLVARVCAAAIGAMGVPASRYQVFERMREFTSKLQSAVQNSPIGAMVTNVAAEGPEGIPVRSVRLQNGQPVEESVITSVTETAFTDDQFSFGNARMVSVPQAGKR